MVELDRDGQFLDRFWTTSSSQTTPTPGKLDPRAAALVRRMQALAATPPPTSAARERVRSRLEPPTSNAPHQEESPMTLTMDLLQPVPIRPNGHLRSTQARNLTRFASSHRAISGSPLSLTAALILLTLAAAFEAIRSGEGNPNDGAKIPAGFAPATPSPSASPRLRACSMSADTSSTSSAPGPVRPPSSSSTGLTRQTCTGAISRAAFAQDTRVCVYDRASQGKAGERPWAQPRIA